MPFVYILSTYEENGAECVCATLDRSKVLPLAEEHFKTGNMDELRSHLERTDIELANNGFGHDFEPYWGGPMLHVVRLDSPPAT